MGVEGTEEKGGKAGVEQIGKIENCQKNQNENDLLICGHSSSYST